MIESSNIYLILYCQPFSPLISFFHRGTMAISNDNDKDVGSPILKEEKTFSAPDADSPLAGMQTFSGMMKSYWTSSKKREAWMYTAAIGALIVGSSQSNVFMAKAAGTFIDTLANLPYSSTETSAGDVLMAGGTILGIALAQHIALFPAKKFALENLHRKWRKWLNTEFNKAILNGRRTYFHLNHGVTSPDGSVEALPKNIDQRWQDSIKSMTGEALGLAHGGVSVVTSAFLVGYALSQSSAPVEGLEFLGDYGTLALTFGAAAAYVPVSTFAAWKIGRYLQTLTNRIEETEGSYRGELNILMRRAFSVAASRSEKVQRKINDTLYRDIDKTWKSYIMLDTGYSAFSGVYASVANKILAYAPALPAYVQGNMSFKNFVTGSELFSSFLNDCSWFITVMPAISRLRAQYTRVSEVARAVVRVEDPGRFYQETGNSNYVFGTQDPVFGIRLRYLRLMYQGHDAKPFLEAGNLRFRPGQWTYVSGPSGSGKSSFLAALNGLLRYGEGQIIMPEGKTSFYASQEIRFPKTSLKQLACIPDDEEDHSDAKVQNILEKVGLGKFAKSMDRADYEGQLWEDVMSGGQKQLLVLARILLQKPDVLFLDEATSALDPASKVLFHELIKNACPDAIVISIMHDRSPPVSPQGISYYDSILEISDGKMHMRRLNEISLSNRYLNPPITAEPTM